MKGAHEMWQLKDYGKVLAEHSTWRACVFEAYELGLALALRCEKRLIPDVGIFEVEMKW